MKKNLRVAVIQTKVPKDNIDGEKQVLRLVKKALLKPIDMIGSPEYCASSLQEAKDGYDALNFVSKIAKINKVYIFGANPLKESDGKIYNLG